MPYALEKVLVPALNVSEGEEKGERKNKVCLLGSGWKARLIFREVWLWKHIFTITSFNALVQMAEHQFLREL